MRREITEQEKLQALFAINSWIRNSDLGKEKGDESNYRE